MPGDLSDLVPPFPIPNKEVKRVSGDDSMGATLCENSSLPGFRINPTQKVGFFVLLFLSSYPALASSLTVRVKVTNMNIDLQGSGMNLLSWIAFGLITGVVAHIFDSRRAVGGLRATATASTIGAIAGGFFANYFFSPGLKDIFRIEHFITAAVVALTAAVLYRTLFRDRNIISTKTGRL